MEEAPLILFDGVCNFCNYWVQLALRKDRKQRLRFATLQGRTAERILPQYGISPQANSSVIFIEEGKAYTQSTAVFRICRYLSGGWRLLSIFRFIPGFLRDPIYRLIARNRYRWFGKKETCMIPGVEQRARFLE